MSLMKMSLREYLDHYAADHTQIGTKITHMIGIPMIVASLPMLPFNPLGGAALFGAGWALQFVGHYVFEHNDPAFFGDPLFLLIGVIWMVMEFANMLGFDISIPEGAPAAAAHAS